MGVLLSFKIFHYDHPHPNTLHEDFNDRLEWQGTMGSKDVQIGAIFIHNVTFNDTGTYRCTFQRTLFLPLDNEYITVKKEMELTVVAEGNGDPSQWTMFLPSIAF